MAESRKPMAQPSLDDLPPHSLEAEQGILGCALLSPQEITGFLHEKAVEKDWFYDLRHQEIYEHLMALRASGSATDLITLQQSLKDAGKLEGVGGLAYLSSLMDVAPSVANHPAYFDLLKEKHVLRGVRDAAVQVLSEIQWNKDRPSDEILSAAIQKLHGLRGHKERTPLKRLILKAIDQIQEEFSGKRLPGLKTGWARFDRATGGLQEGEMFVIAARPSVGKSSILVSISEALITQGHGVGVASIEVSDDSWTRKTLSCLGRLDAMRVGDLNEGQMKAIKNACVRLNQMPLEIISGRSLKLEQIDSFAEFIANKGYKVLMVDYLQKIKNTTKKDSREWVAHCSSELSLIAQRRKLHVIVAAQLNRDTDKDDRRPRLSDLKMSGSIEEDADVVGLLHRTSEKEAPIHEINFDLAKNRNGDVDGLIPFRFYKRQSRFEPVSPIPANPTNDT